MGDMLQRSPVNRGWMEAVGGSRRYALRPGYCSLRPWAEDPVLGDNGQGLAL